MPVPEEVGLRYLALFSCMLAVMIAAPAAEAGKRKTRSDRAIKQIDDQITGAAIDKSDPDWRLELPRPQVVLSFKADRDYIASMQTSKGTIRIRLMPDLAPMHVTSLVYLIRAGFYDGLGFHRVIPGFMVQGGCPEGSGRGGPGYRFSREPTTAVKHDRPGLLSHANAGPNTEGSQFFLTLAPTPWLDGKHTIYGEVIDGMDVLKQIELVGSRSGQPSEHVSINQMTVEVK